MNTITPGDEPTPTPAGLLFDLGAPLLKAKPEPSANPQPRLRLAERTQAEMRIASLDQLLPPDHEVRVVWDYVYKLDLKVLLQEIKAVPGHPGRDATDPRILLALWMHATVDGIGSARTLDILCVEHIAYEWLCGGVSLNYHTLADFRSQHTAVLDQLLTDSVATLLHENLITLKQVAQDGMRVRANAGASSFRREPSLMTCLEEAKTQVEALKNQLDEDSQAASRRQQAARMRAASERQKRIEQALAERAQLVDKREQQRVEKGVKFNPATLRTSTTDPEATRMKMPDGGTRPAFNVQFATTVEGGVIVGVDVSTDRKALSREARADVGRWRLHDARRHRASRAGRHPSARSDQERRVHEGKGCGPLSAQKERWSRSGGLASADGNGRGQGTVQAAIIDGRVGECGSASTWTLSDHSTWPTEGVGGGITARLGPQSAADNSSEAGTAMIA